MGGGTIYIRYSTFKTWDENGPQGPQGQPGPQGPPGPGDTQALQAQIQALQTQMQAMQMQIDALIADKRDAEAQMEANARWLRDDADAKMQEHMAVVQASSAKVVAKLFELESRVDQLAEDLHQRTESLLMRQVWDGTWSDHGGWRER